LAGIFTVKKNIIPALTYPINKSQMYTYIAIFIASLLNGA